MKRLKYKDWRRKCEAEFWEKTVISNEEWAERTGCELIDRPAKPKPPKQKGCPGCGALHTTSLCGDCAEDYQKETGTWMRSRR